MSKLLNYIVYHGDSTSRFERLASVKKQHEREMERRTRVAAKHVRASQAARGTLPVCIFKAFACSVSLSGREVRNSLAGLVFLL